MPKIRTSITSAVISMVVLIGFGTWAYQVLEGWTWGQSFYFSVASLTTVGYGDIAPSTDAARVFTAIYILVGVGVVIAALTSIGSHYLKVQDRQLSESVARRVHKKVEESKKK